MLNISDLQTGTFIIYNGQPHQVIYKEHSKLGRGGAILRTKLKNLISGAIYDTTFKGNERLEEANITRSKAQFTYKDSNGFNFMNMVNFEQFSLSQNQVGPSGGFLKEGMDVDVLNWNGKAININPPIKVELEIAETEPAIRGNTAQGSVTKPAMLETGAKIQVPIFIKPGDIVRVNTETGMYVERVNKS
ncbi:MAG: elongation factor P [Candidatus Berkelbacteria bacterium]|nr:elongation factor P [Candidatus Berkelbacteria bacterium]